MTASQLIGQVSRFGYAIVFDGDQPRLQRAKGSKELPPEMLQKLKSRRDDIIAFFRNGGEPKPPEPETPPVEEPQPGPVIEEQKWYPLFGPDDDAAFASMAEWNRQVRERKVNGTDIQKTQRVAGRTAKKGGRGEAQKDELPGMGRT